MVGASRAKLASCRSRSSSSTLDAMNEVDIAKNPELHLRLRRNLRSLHLYLAAWTLANHVKEAEIYAESIRI